MRKKPSVISALVAAIVAVLAAWGVRVLLEPLVGERVPFITFFPAAFALAWWGGWRPTLIAALMSIPVLVFFILEPKYSFAVTSPEYRAGLAIWFAFALATGWFGEQLHSERWKAKLSSGRPRPNANDYA
jgi:K+-sensing histidine kinase KdpD